MRARPRAAILKESQDIIASVKELDLTRKNLKEQLDIARNKVEEQKKIAELMSALMQRTDIPSEEVTSKRILELQQEIAKAKAIQKEMKDKSNEMHKNIEKSLNMQQKAVQQNKIQERINEIKDSILAEQKRETELKAKQAKLSSDLLKKQVELRGKQELLEKESTEPPDLQQLRKKLNNLQDQVNIISAQKEAFEQEYDDILEQLKAARDKRKIYDSLKEQSETANIDESRSAILESASKNLDLRRYKPLTEEAFSIDNLTELIQECQFLIKCAECELEEEK